MNSANGIFGILAPIVALIAISLMVGVTVSWATSFPWLTASLLAIFAFLANGIISTRGNTYERHVNDIGKALTKDELGCSKKKANVVQAVLAIAVFVAAVVSYFVR